MPTEPVHLIGAGGHGRVVADALIRGGVDPEAIHGRDARTGLTMLGRDVATPELALAMREVSFHVAVGSSAVRQRLFLEAIGRGGDPRTVIHPAAIVASNSTLGAGSFVAAAAVIAPLVVVGVAAIVNHGAIVDHDVVLGDFCHVAPNATLGGAVSVGRCVLIGSGATVLPGVSIADGTTIGAGAVVLADIKDAGGSWVGNPARKLDR